MRDTISVARVAALHPLIRDEVAALINKVEAGFPSTVAIRVVQGLRTFEEQAALYAQGRTKPGPIVTNAKPGHSYHSYGLAIDFAILYDKDGNGTFEALSWDLDYDFDKDGASDWQEVVRVFTSVGYEWGGTWHKIKDNPHLQKTFGLSIAALIAKEKAGQYIVGTRYPTIP